MSLTSSHVELLIKMIEACSQRGAFRADELKDIGLVYEALKETVAATAAPAPAPAPPSVEEFVPAE